MGLGLNKKVLRSVIVISLHRILWHGRIMRGEIRPCQDVRDTRTALTAYGTRCDGAKDYSRHSVLILYRSRYCGNYIKGRLALQYKEIVDEQGRKITGVRYTEYRLAACFDECEDGFHVLRLIARQQLTEYQGAILIKKILKGHKVSLPLVDRPSS
jgi:hypothetical protein